MENFEIPDGNGQEIYIDPEELYIKPNWINKELYTIFMPDIPEKQSNPVYETYKEIFRIFYEKGYKILTDSKMVNQDTFFFFPCLDKHVNRTKEDYVRNKKSKIFFNLMNNGIFEPFSISFPIDTFPIDLPSLPFVLKNENSQGGNEKFLIKTKEQLEILKKFYQEINSYSKQQIIENGRSNHGMCIDYVDYKNEFHKNMRIQKFIKTPTKYNTSLRVLTSSSGDILASSLKYAESKIQTEKKYYGLFDKYLSDPSSPYFLGSECIISNTVAGGNSILLGKDNYSKLEKEILVAHEIDPNNAVVPEKVLMACIDIAVNCKHEIGAICGLDFIYDAEEKTWKYLEEHEYPMLYSYAEKYKLQYDVNSKNFYIETQLLDFRARLHALNLTMQKKNTLLLEHKNHI